MLRFESDSLHKIVASAGMTAVVMIAG